MLLKQKVLNTSTRQRRSLIAMLLGAAAALFGAAGDIKFVEVASGFTGITHIAAMRDGTSRFYVAEHAGVVKELNGDQTRVVLDIRDRVWQRPKPCCDEQGLLGLTFPLGQ